jgi:HKD family nuclease
MPKANAATSIVPNWATNHGDTIKARLSGAVRFTCMVAFAKDNGLTDLLPHLRKCVQEGMSATFVVGIDFYQTEPSVLSELIALKRLGVVEVYMGSFERQHTFHPKLYLFETARGASVIAGSANLTGGGLAGNHEVSILSEGDHAAEINGWIDDLVAEGEIVAASSTLVKEYARRHAIYSRQMSIARKRAERAISEPEGGVDTLAAILAEMKADRSEWGFYASRDRRAVDRRRGLSVLKELASASRMTPASFLDVYERLIASMHSGGLHRAKTTIMRSSVLFRKGTRALLVSKERGPAILFDRLVHAFRDVDRAGVNVVTEMLHLVDNRLYPVMNRNSVSGMRLAGVSEFPPSPTKRNVDGATYASFCQAAAQVRDGLELADFSELDAVFNYAYWR